MELKYGIIGGSTGGIATTHRIAASEDGLCSLAAGCFSRDREKNLHTGTQWGIPQDRIYSDYEEMASKEALRPDGIDFCSVTTPNSTHYEICKAFLSRGISVVCEKPFTCTSAQAQELIDIAKEKNAFICICYTYTSFPMLRLAKALVNEGKIGDIITVQMQYARESRLKALTSDADISGIWRLHSNISGPGGTISDLGTHVENIVTEITGLKIESLSAHLTNIPRNTDLDTNASVLLKFNSGVSGLIWVSQVAAGSNNEIKMRICGTNGALDWDFQSANELRFYPVCGDYTTYRKFNCSHPAVKELFRKGCGLDPNHEAFANIYKAFARRIIAQKQGTSCDDFYADGQAGLNGVRFVEACVESSQNGGTPVHL